MKTNELKEIKDLARRIAAVHAAGFPKLMQEMDPIEIEEFLRHVGEYARNPRPWFWRMIRAEIADSFIVLSVRGTIVCPKDLSDKGEWHLYLRRPRVRPGEEAAWQISVSWFPGEECRATPEEEKLEGADFNEDEFMSAASSEWITQSEDGNWWANLIARNACALDNMDYGNPDEDSEEDEEQEK